MEITKKSQQYLDEIFLDYVEVNSLPKELYGRTILHLYPVRDTDNGKELDGFVDALFFDLHIYNCETMTVYKTDCKDQIRIDVPCATRIFKDGSTMIIIDSPVAIHLFQSVDIQPV